MARYNDVGGNGDLVKDELAFGVLDVRLLGEDGYEFASTYDGGAVQSR